MGAGAPALHAARGGADAGVTVLLYVVIPKDLFPVQSTGQLQGQVQAASDVSFERMSALQGDAARLVLQDPVLSQLGGGGGCGQQQPAVLGPHGDQPQAARAVWRLRGRHHAAPAAKVAEQVAGVTLFLQPTQDLTIDSDTGPTQYRFDLKAWTRPGQPMGAAPGPPARCPAAPRHHRIGATGRPPWSVDATPPRAWASPPAPWTARCTTPLASASSPPSSPRPTSTA
jgi:hypothetical protein